MVCIGGFTQNNQKETQNDHKEVVIWKSCSYVRGVGRPLTLSDNLSMAVDYSEFFTSFQTRPWCYITVLVGCGVRRSGPEEQGRQTFFTVGESIIDEDEACL